MKARQNLEKRVAKLEFSVYVVPDPSEQRRLLDERQRLQERRGIVATPPPSGSAGDQ